MNTNFFNSNRLALRAVEPEDLDFLYTVENDPELWDISNFSVPYSRFALKQYISQSQADMFADRQLRLMIMQRSDWAVVGTLDIMDFEPKHMRGEVGIAISRKYQQQGYAKEALEMLCNYAFHFLHFKQLTAHVTTTNEPSLKLFKACGFETCGILKEWWRVGDEYKDVALLQLLAPDK